MANPAATYPSTSISVPGFPRPITAANPASTPPSAAREIPSTIARPLDPAAVAVSA